MKVGNCVVTPEERVNLQTCLNKLTEWAAQWCMSFNTEKCKVLHVGHRNQQQDYTMNGTQAEVNGEGTGLGNYNR